MAKKIIITKEKIQEALELVKARDIASTRAFGLGWDIEELEEILAKEKRKYENKNKKGYIRIKEANGNVKEVPMHWVTSVWVIFDGSIKIELSEYYEVETSTLGSSSSSSEVYNLYKKVEDVIVDEDYNPIPLSEIGTLFKNKFLSNYINLLLQFKSREEVRQKIEELKKQKEEYEKEAKELDRKIKELDLYKKFSRKKRMWSFGEWLELQQRRLKDE